MQQIFRVVLFCLVCTVSALAQVEISENYMYQGSQVVLTHKWFGLNGGRADIKVPIKGKLSLVGEVGGVYANNVAATGDSLRLLTAMAGPRYTVGLGRKPAERRRSNLFFQALCGSVMGSGGFPVNGAWTESSSALALSGGGGLQINAGRNVALRVVQVDYIDYQLPNLYDERQNNLRLGAGIVFKLGK